VSDPPRYIIPCFLGSPVQEYQRELVDLIAGRFGFTVTQRQAIPAHFRMDRWVVHRTFKLGTRSGGALGG
jgi:hypothetical protein